MPQVIIHGIILELDIHYAESSPSTQYTNGYSELEWSATSAQDELGENISRKSLDLFCNEYINDIERAIWAQIEG
ncbi:hypothetical protein D3C85_1246810 [compost metagenome]